MELKTAKDSQHIYKEKNNCVLQKKIDYLRLKNSERICQCLVDFVQEEHWNDILVILYMESRGDSLAFNGQDYGAMQINKVHIKSGIAVKDSLFYMDYNIKTAYNKIFVKWCLKDYKNRFKRYNGSIAYQRKAEKLLETL